MIKRKITKRPPRIVVHGVASVGKTTLAAHSPSPVFICCEDGAREVDAAVYTFDDKDRVQPKTLDEFRAAVRDITKSHEGYKTLVIDGVSDLDRLVSQHLCAKNPKWGGDIQFLGYGRPEALILGVWREMVAEFEEANNAGLGIILLGHSRVENFAPPDAPNFSRYQLAVTSHKLGDVAGLLFGWSDVFGFARFMQMTTEAGKRTIGTGIQGARVLQLQRLDSSDAKCRYKNAPAQIPMSWAELERVMTAGDVNAEDLRSQIEALIPSLPADKRAATTAWLTDSLTVDDLVIGLDKVKSVITLQAQ
jgi:hypothetical protein